MDAIVTAGGKPRPDEPLYQYTQGINKAMLDVAGKPMIQWILDALGASAGIERVIIIGLPDSSSLSCTKPLTFIEDHGGILANLQAGAQEVLRARPQHQQVLAVSSDVPGIKGEMIDWLIQKIQPTDLDIYYNVIPQAVMEKRYPGSHRTYTRLKDVVVTGGDVNALNTRIFAAEKPVWGKIIQARKNPFQQASLIGYDTLFLLVTRQITLEKAVKVITPRLGITGQAIICPFAEMGMDVDKPHQLEMMRADMSHQNV
jgi:molybdopterin-guanine dinucleotide biosynthesis protein A